MKKSALKSEKELKTSCEARHRKKKSLVEPRGMRGSLRHCYRNGLVRHQFRRGKLQLVSEKQMKDRTMRTRSLPQDPEKTEQLGGTASACRGVTLWREVVAVEKRIVHGLHWPLDTGPLVHIQSSQTKARKDIKKKHLLLRFRRLHYSTENHGLLRY